MQNLCTALTIVLAITALSNVLVLGTLYLTSLVVIPEGGASLLPARLSLSQSKLMTDGAILETLRFGICQLVKLALV